ncbi:MAG: glucose-6-phosphate isomerase [Pseudomonadota bacterium]
MKWDDLKSLTGARIVDLLQDPDRPAAFSVLFGDMLFDYSKTSLTVAARDALLDLAGARDLAGRREAMYSGARINETERRAVLHVALRACDGARFTVDGQDVMPGVREVRARMAAFVRDVRAGHAGGTGGAYTDVVNIGIGGSHLGPEMAVRALAPFHDGPRCHFVSNVDGADIAQCLASLDPARTLVIVASKTFTTIETMTNAATARAWLADHVQDPGAQMAAVSSALDKTSQWGIAPERVFGFEDWVGGRYSLWGPIGLPLMLAIGADRFSEFLNGGAEMDSHFREAPPTRNMPVMLAMVGLWHSRVCGYATRAILPYDQRLVRLPAYLQQLEMESNGKRVAMDGTPVDGPTGPVVWGEPGTNGQHAFYQLIHQGTQVVPCEFLVAARGFEPDLDHHHRLLLANCLAQSEALMLGRDMTAARDMMAKAGFTGADLDRQAAHRVFPGNRPSTTLIYDRLTPQALGRIIALYEHRVFVEGTMLGINSFDQWGVELGKDLAREIEPLLSSGSGTAGKDGSTRQLLDFARKIRP